MSVDKGTDGHYVGKSIIHPLCAITVEARCIGDKAVITGVSFGIKKASGKMGESAAPHNVVFDRIVASVKSILDGVRKDSADVPLDLAPCTPFQKKILSAARNIPWGATVSYARLAALAGHPKAVRAAASVMRNNPFPLIIPCHRVVGSDGAIGGFMGKKEGAAVDLKRALLKREGCRIGQGPAG
jgi:methylated-DNA-[protein]-cysteine S-methyltransferase